MSTTAELAPTTAVTTTAAHRPVWRHGLAAAVGAAVATTLVAAIAGRAGVSFEDPTGAAIPLLGFAQLTLVFSLLGVGLAAVLARRARRPRSTFVRITLALTALSVVPDFTFGFDAASAATLAATHVVAGSIVIPVLAGRLVGRR